MKRIILGLCMLVFVGQNSFAETSSCLELKTYNVEELILVSNEISVKKYELLKLTLDYMKNIIDLKFKAHQFIENNKNIYGKYISLKEERDVLILVIKELELEKEEIRVYYDQEIAKLDNALPEKVLKRELKELIKEKKIEFSRITYQISKLNRDKKKVDKKYFKVLKKWAPFKDHLISLETLEKSLVSTLQNLEKIESIDLSLVSNAVGIVSSFEVSATTDTDEQESRCADVLENIKLMVSEASHE